MFNSDLRGQQDLLCRPVQSEVYQRKVCQMYRTLHGSVYCLRFVRPSVPIGFCPKLIYFNKLWYIRIPAERLKGFIVSERNSELEQTKGPNP